LQRFFYNEKIRNGRKIYCAKCKRKVQHFKNIDNVNSLLDLAKNTISKILIRAKKKCVRCGWYEGSLNIHHINGKKILNFNNHDNLVILCPNCYRLCHNHKINKEELQKISINKTFTDWKTYYYPSN